MGSQRVRHDWATNTFTFSSSSWQEKNEEGAFGKGRDQEVPRVVTVTCSGSAVCQTFPWGWGCPSTAQHSRCFPLECFSAATTGPEEHSCQNTNLQDPHGPHQEMLAVDGQWVLRVPQACCRVWIRDSISTGTEICLNTWQAVWLPCLAGHPPRYQSWHPEEATKTQRDGQKSNKTVVVQREGPFLAGKKLLQRNWGRELSPAVFTNAMGGVHKNNQ